MITLTATCCAKTVFDEEEILDELPESVRRDLVRALPLYTTAWVCMRVRTGDGRLSRATPPPITPPTLLLRHGPYSAM